MTTLKSKSFSMTIPRRRILFESNRTAYRLASYIAKEHPSLTTDYMIVFEQLLSGDTAANDRNFAEIHSALTMAVGTVDPSTSGPLQRLLDPDGSTVDTKFRSDAAEFYWNLLDSLFTFFVHSFDLGYRLGPEWEANADGGSAADAATDDEKDSDIAGDVHIQKLRAYLLQRRSALHQALPDLVADVQRVDEEDTNYDRLALLCLCSLEMSALSPCFGSFYLNLTLPFHFPKKKTFKTTKSVDTCFVMTAFLETHCTVWAMPIGPLHLRLVTKVNTVCAVNWCTD